MRKLQFKILEKRSPSTAKKFFNELESLLIFLNSPARDKWLKFSGLTKKEIKHVKDITDSYAKKKIQLEKKLKPKNKNDVLKIEVKILKEIFLGEVIKLKSGLNNAETLEIANNILKIKYPDAVILNMMKTDKLATMTGINTLNNFPTDLLIFDTKHKKIIGINLVIN